MSSVPTSPPAGHKWDANAYASHLNRLVGIASVEVPEIVLPESNHVVVDGLRLHYLDWGGGADDREPIVMLHGGGLNAHTWDVVALSMRSRRRCIAIDLRGHGESEWSRSLDYTIALHTADTIGVLDALGLDRVVMMGMSLGGIVSLSLTLSRPERVAALVLVDVGPPPLPDGVSRVNTFMRKSESFASIDEAIEVAMKFNPKRDPRLLAWTLRQNLMQVADGTLTWKYDRRHRTTSVHVDEIVADNRVLAERVEEVECPLLLVYGERSDVVSSEDALAFAGRARDGRAVGAPGAGHSVQGDNPAALVAHLNRFFDEVERRDDSVAPHERKR